ncbi:acylneuraminate cytidylyltransferase [Gracilibacillus sp. YIM 98692]|uniref:acylneuraminate cytidylyltransferase n=1 Tax=Gracilibacillus sp. YIM 98692 TaxID=2663532 RepID=UPI001969A759|nr:acylneuraminate cytidylyltransferase [Gracilibacillus sp. YIM 98692]
MSRIGKTVAFIPLRGKSKSIPLKNVKKINGRPLVYWVLDAAVNCEKIDKVVVATDSNEIKYTVNQYGSDKIMVIGRSKDVSTDSASTESVMLEFASNYYFEDIVLVQATSPLLTSRDLNKGIEKYSHVTIDSVLSVVRQKRFIWEKSNLTAKPVNYDPLNRPRRQEFDGFLVENGAFYITSRNRLLKTKCRISGNVATVELREESYYEIDEPNDWILVENLLKRTTGQKSCGNEKIRNIKCLLADCDGVLTDGGMYYSETGHELKKFNTKDGMGFKLLQEKGLKTGIITGENIELVKRRAAKMKVDIVYLGIKNKMKILDEMCGKFDLSYDEIAYIGDDINDLEVIKAVGFGCTVNDGIESVKDAADYVTKVDGGKGAIREVAEILLNAKD